MKFIKIKTRVFLPPKDDLWDLLNKIKSLKDRDIFVITSKILAIHQGRCLKIKSKREKQTLIKNEADWYAWAQHPKNKKLHLLTIKHNTFVSASGLDQSNGNGYHILWPTNINHWLKLIHRRLIKKFKIKNLGLICTDSHSMPLRRGSTGISIGFYGFEPHRDYRGKPDIFGRKFKLEISNVVDAYAAIAVHLMGEGNEQTPMLIIRGADVKFTRNDTYKKLVFPIEKDLFYPLFKVFQKGGNLLK